MASVLSIISKAQFEELAGGRPGGAKVGDSLGIDAYLSTHRALDPLADGGALFLVTVRSGSVGAGDELLWLVGVLESPRRVEKGWVARPSSVAIADITHRKAELRFVSGKGVPVESGKLAMSLQTPRALTEADERLLRAATSRPDRGALPEAAARAPAAVAMPAAKKSASTNVGGERKRAAAPTASSPVGGLAVAPSGTGASPLESALAALRAGDAAMALRVASRCGDRGDRRRSRLSSRRSRRARRRLARLWSASA